MEFQKLTAEVRTGRKKGTSRRLRRGGFIPAVCYGPDREAPIALSVDPKGLGTAVSGPLGRNAVIELTVTGDGAPAEPVLVMLQDAQRHPVGRALLHADFITVAREREVTVSVPFRVEGRSVGVTLGGVLAQVLRELPVRCALDAIPSEIVADVTSLNIGGAIKVADLVLPEGIVVTLEPNRTLASVSVPKAVVETAPGEGEEAAEAAPAEAAPAADAKKSGS